MFLHLCYFAQPTVSFDNTLFMHDTLLQADTLFYYRLYFSARNRRYNYVHIPWLLFFLSLLLILVR